ASGYADRRVRASRPRCMALRDGDETPRSARGDPLRRARRSPRRAVPREYVRTAAAQRGGGGDHRCRRLAVRRVGLLDRPAPRARHTVTRVTMAHYDLSLPLGEDAVRALRVNDTVTLQDRLFGIRDATQIALFDRGRTTRLDLRGHAVIHTAPNVRQVDVSPQHTTGYAPVCIGTTTSMRMERFTEPLMRDLGVRIV